MAQSVKSLCAMWETWVQSLGQEYPLGEGSGNLLQYSSGESHGQKSLAGYSTWGCKESDTTEEVTQHVADSDCCKAETKTIL